MMGPCPAAAPPAGGLASPSGGGASGRSSLAEGDGPRYSAEGGDFQGKQICQEMKTIHPGWVCDHDLIYILQ